MYTVSKGPSKIVAKTRRGISHSQNLERMENLRENKRPLDVDTPQVVNVPKPVFHCVNGKRSSNQRVQQETISPQHAELINFIYESWDKVYKEFEQEPSENNHSVREGGTINDDTNWSHANFQNRAQQCIVYHNDGEPSPVLQDFKPFDLESWWGKRLFNNITKSI